ncbi:MAG: ABC transporter substrate-binding protein [Myxococcota bacterium]
MQRTDTSHRPAIVTEPGVFAADDRPARRPRFQRLLLLLLLLLPPFAALLGCGPRQDGEAARAPVESHRIVSLSPLASALLEALGATDRVFAVDVASGGDGALAHRLHVPDEDEAALLMIQELEADLVVLPPTRIPLSLRLNAVGIRTIVVVVRDFEDAFTLWGELAGQVGRAVEARDRITALARGLSAISAESYGSTRPRVAVVDSFEPLVLVGHDRLESALVEIAGGECLTHGRSEAAIAITRAELAAQAPDLIFHALPPVRPAAEGEAEAEAAPPATEALAATFGDIAPLVRVPFDPIRFFERETLEAARTLHEAIAARAGPAPPAPPAPTDSSAVDSR